MLLLWMLLWMLLCRENHGVQTMYEFAEDCGSMERSRYFGFSKGTPALGTSNIMHYHNQHTHTRVASSCGTWAAGSWHSLPLLVAEAADTNIAVVASSGRHAQTTPEHHTIERTLSPASCFHAHLEYTLGYTVG
jgi:hypothetical protein